MALQYEVMNILMTTAKITIVCVSMCGCAVAYLNTQKSFFQNRKYNLFQHK